jgi:hypothetical protein
MFTEAAIRLGREVCSNKITIEVCFLVQETEENRVKIIYNL